MSNNKKVKSKGILNNDLLHRIDNIEDANEYNPYQAVKKTTVINTELFNEQDYAVGEDDVILRDGDLVNKEKRKNIVVAIIVGLLMMGTLGGLIYLIYAGGLQL